MKLRIIETHAAPSPRRVNIFLAEKGIVVPREELNMMTDDLKTGDFAKLNPWARVPVLILDDGRAISETVAICRYFEEISPEPPLFGIGPVGKAEVECGTGASRSDYSTRSLRSSGICTPGWRISRCRKSRSGAKPTRTRSRTN